MKRNYNLLPLGSGISPVPLVCSCRIITRLTKRALLLAASLTIFNVAQTSAQTELCIPDPGFVDGDGITNVNIGSINNITRLETPNYGDYTSQVVNLGQGVSYPISVTIATGSSYNVKVWVDWNNNDIFETGEQALTEITETTNTAIVTGNITVPATATLGNHRLRIGITPYYAAPVLPCYSGFDAAAYEDYTINVTTTPTCFLPRNLAVANAGPGIINLSWAAPANGNTATGYEYAITTTATPPASGTAVTATSVTGITVPMDVTGYIYLRSTCGNNNYSEWVAASFYNGVCVPTPALVNGEGITNFTFGTINNETLTEDGNYGNFTNLATSVGQGVTKTFSVTLSTGSSYRVGIWVDWNNDLDFDDEGERVYTGTSANRAVDVLSGTITVPANASLGAHRLRVGGGLTFGQELVPCYTDFLGTFEDYTINVTTPPSCFTPLSPTGVSVAAGVANISWTAPSLGTTPAGYEYAVTTSAIPPATGTALNATTANNVTVTANTVNYIHVRTNCGGNDYSEWMTSSYYNGYCTPEPTYVDGDGITNFTIGTINNTGVPSLVRYEDYTDQVAAIGQGVNKQFSLTFNTSGIAYRAKIWADWNNDLDFDDEGELLYSGITVNSNPATITGTFIVPAATALGEHRLRIGITPSYNAAPTPCGPMNTAGIEDYTINVTTPPSCSTPTAPVAVATAANTANLTWTAPALGTPIGYEYAVITAQNPPVSGIPVTDTFVNGYTGLEDNIYYYLYVRTNCGDGNYSEWIVSSRFRYLAGDACATAVDLATQTSPYSSTTVGANNDYMPPCATNSSSPDLFYKIEVGNGYTLTINQTQNVYDSYQSIFYGGCEAGSRTSLVCTDNNTGGTTWENLTGSSQTVYFVQDGWGSNAGIFTLTWSLTPPVNCDVPRNADVNLISLTSANISWTAPNTGLPAGYEYAITTTATPPETGTYTTALSATGVAVTSNTNSYLHVRSACGTQDFSEWVTYAFFSGYCVPVNNASGNYISGIITTGAEVNFSNTGTGTSSYTDYTNEFSVTTYAGGSFALTATHPNGEYLYGVWIDWNNNFDFSDEGERVLNRPYLTSPAALGNILVPAGTPQGTYRMRIRNALLGSPVAICDAVSGEAEDYTVIVGPTPTCFPPFAPSIEPVDATTANLRWSPPILGTLPQGYEYVLSTSSATPTGSGTPTTEIFVEGVTYNPAVSAYLFVRSTCGEGEFSIWETTAILNTNVPQAAKNNVVVYKKCGAINITAGNTIMKGVTIYDVRGTKLYTQNNINATQAAITGMQIQQQVIIVEITTENGKISKRIVF